MDVRSSARPHPSAPRVVPAVIVALAISTVVALFACVKFASKIADCRRPEEAITWSIRFVVAALFPFFLLVGMLFMEALR